MALQRTQLSWVNGSWECSYEMVPSSSLNTELDPLSKENNIFHKQPDWACEENMKK